MTAITVLGQNRADLGFEELDTSAIVPVRGGNDDDEDANHRQPGGDTSIAGHRIASRFKLLSRRKPWLPSTVIVEQIISPSGMLGVERRVRLLKVVDVVVVASFLITSIDQGLKVERDVLIRLTKRKSDRGQSLS